MICVCAGYDFNPPVIPFKIMDILQRDPIHGPVGFKLEDTRISLYLLTRLTENGLKFFNLKRLPA